MKHSAIYHSITIDNPGYIYDYRLCIYQSSVEINIRSPIPLHNGRCLLSYKLQDGQIEWLQQKKTIYYCSRDSLRIIQFLRNIPLRVMDEWVSKSSRIPLLPIQILQQLEQIEHQQISQITLKQQQIILNQRRQDKFAETQRKQIGQGNIECTFCTEVLLPSKFHQLRCGHCFHHPCIRKYCRQVKNQCPICKYTPKRRE